MVALDLVHASNAQLKELGPGLVALFGGPFFPTIASLIHAITTNFTVVGGTSGIGEYTAKAFVKNAFSPRVYIVGRSATAAERIIKECKELNEDGTVEFLKADVTELREVDRVCKELSAKEKHINLIVQTQGNLTLRGRDESPEGLDRKLTLNYYSRMRFISNLLPQLRNATTVAPHFSRTLSVLGAGTERKVNFDDLELKNNFSGIRCAAHSIVMNDFMTEEFAKREPAISFIHSFPGLVNTGVARELPAWIRIPVKALFPLFSAFSVGAEETGARQLFIATSGLYPPAKPFESAPLASGVPAPQGIKKVMTGSDGKEGSGGYLVNWNNEITGKQDLLKEYHEKGFGPTAWKHTIGIFERVEKINQQRASA